jgi:haloacetate dehalogenase
LLHGKCQQALVLWGEKGKIGAWYDALTIWRDYCAANVTGGAVPSGHYIPEETPGELLDWFDRFF